ncbi:MAG: YceD family protein [Bacillaceae bacterium]|nr:YceD family protein [Bacillaceae bacterium]
MILLKWTIQQLNGFKSKGITFDETLDLSDIKKLDPQIRDISPVRVIGEAIFSKNLISFPLEIKGEMTLPCSRSLIDVKFPFHLQVKEVFSLDDHAWISEDEEDDVHTVEGETIDLVPYIMEHILLEIPLQLISKEADEKGLQSGQDWDLITEENKKERIDPRLADLAKFFDEQ